MTSVQDSINALYAEAERNAKDGTPMFALLHGMPADRAPAGAPIPIQPDATAMDTADDSPPQTVEMATTHTDNSSAYADQSRTSRFEALRMLAEREVDDTPLQDDITGTPVTHDSIDREAMRDTVPLTHTDRDLLAALPDQPPAPPALDTDKDLDITDIHQLVQQAWEDGDAGTVGPVSETQDQKSSGDGAISYNGQSTHDQTGEKLAGVDTDNPQHQVTSDIAIAMENIAAAVKDQKPPAATPLDVDALKVEIVQAVKSEFRQALRDDLAPVVRSVVTEVMVEVSKERAAKEMVKKEWEVPKPAVKSTSANASARKTTKSTAAKAARTVKAKVPATKTAESNSTKSTDTKTTVKAKTRAKKTKANLDIG